LNAWGGEKRFRGRANTFMPGGESGRHKLVVIKSGTEGSVGLTKNKKYDKKGPNPT